MFDSKKLLDALMGAPGGAGGSFSDTLGKVAGEVKQGIQQGHTGKPGSGGGFASVIGQVLGQAASGVQDAARGVETRTGVGQKANDALKQATGGQGAGDLLARARELAGQNQLATGAAIGGLAAILLGTGGGRDIAAGAAKLGGLAMIGGLAYKAFQNYQQGKPLIGLGGVEAAPDESPFGQTSDETQDQATSLLLIRAMIAAASADGIVDNAERSRIVGGLQQAGLDVDAAKFLDQEFTHPATVQSLIAGATTPAVATQVYTAARLAVDPDHPAEQRFLAQLSSGLKLDPQLVTNIDAAARSAQAQG
jgi:uncharacterized membrane protein YebE (DUF533 family)